MGLLRQIVFEIFQLISSAMKALFFVIALCASTVSAFSQPRVAVLPIKNSDGNFALNVYCYKIADSLRAALTLSELNGKQFTVVSEDSVAAVLAELNLDPNNAQYESDLWKSIAKLNCQYAITGTFNVNGGRMLLNVYCYNVASKMADQTNAAKNIFKAPEKILDMIPIIRDRLIPALK